MFMQHGFELVRLTTEHGKQVFSGAANSAIGWYYNPICTNNQRDCLISGWLNQQKNIGTYSHEH
jgi:hypothetical protein